MNIIKDFFLLIWKEDVKRIFSSNGDINSFLNYVLKNDYESFCDYSSIILMVSSSNLEKLAEIKEARDSIKFLAGLNEWDKKRIQFVQKELLFFLSKKGDTKLNKAIEKRFDKLRIESVIGYEKTRKLISLLAFIEERREILKPLHVEKAKDGSNFYESAINLFCASIANLRYVIENESLLKRLETIPQKLKNEKFSIGITGVMNAGKSTMLNALLAKEILGTSVIPETANLTVIKYAKTPSAKVNFWNKSEWHKIEQSADTLENMKSFIKETKEYFKENLDEFITKEGKSFEINLDELPSYTSAEHSNKKCNLVKSVELYSNLNFVENGVEIVDTPGLDDPVIQREEITKNYLSRCDLMIHLMNVNQSATSKDIEFITDTLLYQTVARLLIVITRIDTVEQSELEEVITYTKASIKSKLESLNKQNSFDGIIDKIDFIPLAGLQALRHRVGKGDKDYPLEKTGILKVEGYLSEMLFGSNSQKANVIIDATKKELSHIIESTKHSLSVEKNYLGKSSIEIENEHKKYKKEISSIKQKISSLKQKIADEKDELVRYFVTLENFLKNKFISLEAVVKRRVMDDVLYEISKNKKRPDQKRIASIIETALKDGFVEQDFEGFVKENSKNSDSKEFFERHFGDLNLVNSNAVLISKVNSAIKSYSKKDTDGLSLKLDEYFEIALKELYEKFNQKAIKINAELVDGFELESKKPLEAIEFEMNSKEEILSLAKKRAEDKSFDASQRLDEIKQKQNVLTKVRGDLK